MAPAPNSIQDKNLILQYFTFDTIRDLDWFWVQLATFLMWAIVFWEDQSWPEIFFSLKPSKRSQHELTQTTQKQEILIKFSKFV